MKKRVKTLLFWCLLCWLAVLGGISYFLYNRFPQINSFNDADIFALFAIIFLVLWRATERPILLSWHFRRIMEFAHEKKRSPWKPEDYEKFFRTIVLITAPAARVCFEIGLVRLLFRLLFRLEG